MEVKKLQRKCVVSALIVGLSVSLSAHTWAEDLVVLTGYPDKISKRYQDAFEKKYPDKKIMVKKISGSKVLAEAQGGQGADVYWAASYRTFAELKEKNLLAKLDYDSNMYPRMIAGSPIADPDGYYTTFELAGYVIAYNSDVVQKLGLTPPKDWSDLAQPSYFGKVTIPMPKGAGGPAPMQTEIVLQAYGWEKGWAILSEIVGNAYTNKNEEDKKDPLTAGKIAAKMNLDFFVASNIGKDDSVRLVYPQQTAYNPGHIGILTNAKNKETARQFVDFALSEEGQQILYKDFFRLPARRSLFDSGKVPVANPYTNTTLSYSWDSAQGRVGLIAALFNTVLTGHQQELAILWQTLHKAEKEGKKDQAKIMEARKLLSAAPISDAEQADKKLRAVFLAAKDDQDAEKERDGIKKQWEEKTNTRIEKIKELLK